MKKYQCTSKLKKSFSDKFVFSYLDTVHIFPKYL